MQMASWKNYDKWDLCLAGLLCRVSPMNSGYHRIRPDSRSTKISTSATAL